MITRIKSNPNLIVVTSVYGRLMRIWAAFFAFSCAMSLIAIIGVSLTQFFGVIVLLLPMSGAMIALTFAAFGKSVTRIDTQAKTLLHETIFIGNYKYLRRYSFDDFDSIYIHYHRTGNSILLSGRKDFKLSFYGTQRALQVFAHRLSRDMGIQFESLTQ